MGLALDEPEGNEEATKINGIDVLFSGAARELASDTLLDYVKGERGEGFTLGSNGTCS